MSKTTKIIAALGVVAGLGVAALPAFTYADTYVPASVNGNADVYVEVEPAIAMTITGNNDDNSHAGAASSNAAVAVKNPSTMTTINGVDVSSFEDTTATKASSSFTKLLPNSSVHGNDGASSGTDNGFYSTITVHTNSVNGYNLGISALTALVNQTDNTKTIAANGIVKAGLSGWGYAKSVQTDATGDTPTANYLTAANTALFYSDTKTADTTGDVNKVFYGVSTAPNEATGVYKSTITYTATTKNAAH